MRDEVHIPGQIRSSLLPGRPGDLLKTIVNEHERFSGAKLSVIMPAYNEAERIFGSVLKTAEALRGLDFEIIVVDDGSADGTRDEGLRAARELSLSKESIAGTPMMMEMNLNPRLVVGAAKLEGQRPNGKRLAATDRVKVVGYDVNRGKGHALRFGFGHSTGDLVAFLDADLDLAPSQVRALWTVMRQTGADVVIGSKMHPESKLDYPPVRKLISHGYYALVRLLFNLPIHDSQTGLKLFRREVLERVLPRMQVQRFAHDLELLVGAHRFGYRMAESPVLVTFRRTQARPAALARATVNVWLDTLRVFYWASFWNWLKPGPVTKFWMLALLLGVSALSFGSAGFLTRLGVPQALSEVADILFMKFITQPARDALLILAGLVAVCVACIQLNKHVSDAFVRPDEGGLADITKALRDGFSERHQEQQTEQEWLR